MYDGNYPSGQNSDHQVRWNGTSYSSGPYRMEDLRSAPAPQPPQKKRGWAALKVISLVLCCALVGGAAGMGGAALYNTFLGTDGSGQGGSGSPSGAGATLHENNTPSGTTVNVEQADGLTPMTLSEIYAAYVDACVVITSEVPYTTNTWYGPYSGVETYAGSGFVISENGYIVTNYHVIDGAETIRVTFHDGREYEAAYVGGEEANDVAVLKIDADGLEYVVLGNSDDLLVGQQVSTIGNALGTLSFSQTSGAVSGLGRSVTYSDGTIINMIQTDCTINSGNSGGPLFDSYGRVVGITSAKYSNNADASAASIENIGFAIPINDVKGIITDILEHGYVIRPYMGILDPATVTDSYAQAFGWPYGVYVNDVDPGSCAETAGIKKGDIITKLGDTEVTSVAELTAAKNQYSPGDTVEVTVYRSGEYLTLKITFDESQDPTADNGGQNDQGSQGGSGGFGGFGSFGGR